MIKIELPNKGLFTLVDDEDYEKVIQYDLYAVYCKSVKSYYVAMILRDEGKIAGIKLMHRFIMGVEDSNISIDHKDHNTLNNQKSNLRKCTKQQNCFNRRISKTANTSGYKGVTWNKQRNKWKAVIKINRKQIYIGSFNSKVEAALAYNEKAKELFGEFAYLNIIKESE